MIVRLLAVIAAVLLPAAAAEGSTVRLTDAGVLQFAAAPGERNAVSLRPSEAGFAIEVRDEGAAIAPGPSCTSADDHTVHCGSLFISGPIEVRLGDLDDRLSTAVTGPAATPVVADGGPGDDRLVGGPGDDRLGGGPGRDELEGGAGIDAVSYEGHASPVVVNLRNPSGDGAPGENDAISGFERVVGGNGDDRLVGDNGPNEIDGGSGRDRLIGRRGDDVFARGGGRVSCGDGEDVIENRHLGFFGSALVDHVEPDCERIRYADRAAEFTLRPAVTRPKWLGWRVACPTDARRCAARVRVVALKDESRVLARGRLRRGTRRPRLVRVRLTPLGVRRLAGRGDRVVGVEIAGHAFDRPMRWTLHVTVPALIPRT